MENKIPTAQEFYNQCRKNWDFNGDNPIPDSYRVMIEFAKLHVEAALKEASEKADLCVVEYYEHEVDKNSILNAYPLENIK